MNIAGFTRAWSPSNLANIYGDPPRFHQESGKPVDNKGLKRALKKVANGVADVNSQEGLLNDRWVWLGPWKIVSEEGETDEQGANLYQILATALLA